MKKYIALILCLFATFQIASLSANAEDKSSGTSNTISRMSGVDPNIQSAKPSTTPTPVPTAIPTPPKGAPVDLAIVKKNQSKDNYVANGILLLTLKDYVKAMDEFKKAQAIASDKVTQRWYDVAFSKKKAKDIDKIIKEMEKVLGKDTTAKK